MSEEKDLSNVELFCEGKKRFRSKAAWEEIAIYLRDERNYKNWDIDYILRHGLKPKETSDPELNSFGGDLSSSTD